MHVPLPHPTRTPAPIRSRQDAVRLLAVAVTRPLEAEIWCFPLDDEGRGGTATVVSDTHRPDTLLDVVELIGEATATAGLTSLVVATVRPHHGLLPGDADRWLEASAICDLVGVRLVEWFVVGPHGVATPRDLLGEPERWPQ